jgi:trehalose 6-phosphate phosphatase
LSSDVPIPAALAPLVAAARQAVLMVDFDGSLAPIVDVPASARPLPAVRDALAHLTPLLRRVAVVSGRPAEFLAMVLSLDGVDYVGQYGLERLVDGVVVVDPRVEPYVDAIAAAADAADAAAATAMLRGLIVERKGRISVTLHFRTAPDLGPAARAVADELSARYGLAAPARGRMAIELRPPVPVDKGTVAVELSAGCRVAAFAGDDSGDVAAFVALRRLADSKVLDHAVTIGVTSAESPPEILAADAVVSGPAPLAELLDAVAAAVTRPG